MSETDWNNRSMADVLPTYRWMIENEGRILHADNPDLRNAFYGGNSMKLMKYGSRKKSTINYLVPI
ncbi:MAG: hypothetical protein ACLRQF_07850 [Thomasclavelia ramosa]